MRLVPRNTTRGAVHQRSNLLLILLLSMICALIHGWEILDDLCLRTWIRAWTIELVCLYEFYPEIWDSRHMHYKERDKRTVYWLSMGNNLNTSVAEVQWKIHNLRNQVSNNFPYCTACKPEGKRPLRTPKRRWEDNIEMDLREVGRGRGDWMELAQGRNRWRALVNTVMNFRVQ